MDDTVKIRLLPQDTTLEAARIRFSILRRLGFAGRARAAIEASDGLREVAESGIHPRHPDYNEDMVRLAALRLAVGDLLFHKCHPGVEVKS
ncbi:MAG: hypothetical protein HYU64_04815 [Armatimonadetes bacterium]|nr:hypothetical protein [Armatimonadota bacterium]